MDEILRFLVNYEIQIYTILGVGGVIYLGRVLHAANEWRGASFGLEKENARHRFSNAMTIVLIFFVLAAVELFMVSFFIPNRPQSPILATPTLDLLTTPTATLIVGTKPVLTPTGFALTMPPVLKEGCIPGQIEWTFPKNGGELKGTVKLKGTIQVSNLGFYKYEYSKAGEDKWTTIAADSKPKKDEEFGGLWNTTDLPKGDYRLRLVVADNQNQILPACVIAIRIVSP
jgi:hypothetical protein